VRAGLILGDQLGRDLPTLDTLDRGKDLVVMAELYEEATYVKHHKQKIALLFSGMRHFASELESDGWRVHYHKYDPKSPLKTFEDVLKEVSYEYRVDSWIVTECGEHRLQQQIDNWSSALDIDVCVLDDTRFICDKKEFAEWARGRKQLRMEYFYRQMRRKTGLLMEEDQPAGGEWNYDAENRKSLRDDVDIPERKGFDVDRIDAEVIKLVTENFADHPGHLDTDAEQFQWPRTRKQAQTALRFFINHCLADFGQYQDAMSHRQPFLFHSLLATSLNMGLLSPVEVCRAAEHAWQKGDVPINAAEGFIRQIIGWREYVRGLYWWLMPDYAKHNHFRNQRKLPACYWNGDTRMNCMAQSLKNTFDNAYAHHIQRLMVTGNFALLAGVEPTRICDWYLAVYADAYDWVELPNTLGMVMHADGGLMASKPYAASGSYINRMSDYCKHCHYSVKTAVDDDSCPFNSLYWHFIMRHDTLLRDNPRMSMIYRNLDKMSDDKKRALKKRGDFVLEHIDAL